MAFNSRNTEDGLTDNGATASAGTYTFTVKATSGGQSVTTTSSA